MKKAKNRTVPLWFYPAFGSMAVATAVCTILLGYITFYSTNILKLPPSLVGILLLCSKIFDGFADLVAGFIIDRTNTRFGKARPYDLANIFYCIFIIALFSVPQMGINGTAAYVFIVYTLIFSVFSTLIYSAGPIYLSRSVPDDETRVKVLAFTGVIATLVAMVIAIIMPRLISTLGTTREGWMKIALFIAGPCLFIGMIRFFTIKETLNSNVNLVQKFSLKQAASLLFHNKYCLIFALVLLLVNVGQNMNQSNAYYYTYIVGDISMQSLVGVGMMFSPIILALSPLLSKKIGLVNVMRLGLCLGIIGFLMPLLGLRSVPLLIIGSVLTTSAIYPIFILSGSIVINCIDYGEWKSHVRGEAIYACITGFSAKLGMGLSSVLVGIVLTMGGFDSTLSIQSKAANTSITLLYTVIPAVIFILALIALSFFNLEKKLPQIKKDLAARHNMTVNENTETSPAVTG